VYAVLQHLVCCTVACYKQFKCWAKVGILGDLVTSVNSVTTGSLSFKKQLQKLLGDNPQWAKKAKDKKWFKYNNLVEIAQFYDETAQK
jgi:hypothetical protein